MLNVCKAVGRGSRRAAFPPKDSFHLRFLGDAVELPLREDDKFPLDRGIPILFGTEFAPQVV